MNSKIWSSIISRDLQLQFKYASSSATKKLDRGYEIYIKLYSCKFGYTIEILKFSRTFHKWIIECTNNTWNLYSSSSKKAAILINCETIIDLRPQMQWRIKLTMHMSEIPLRYFLYETNKCEEKNPEREEHLILYEILYSSKSFTQHSYSSLEHIIPSNNIVLKFSWF